GGQRAGIAGLLRRGSDTLGAGIRRFGRRCVAARGQPSQRRPDRTTLSPHGQHFGGLLVSSVSYTDSERPQLSWRSAKVAKVKWSRRESNPRPLECHPTGTPSHQPTPAHKWREHRAVRRGAFASCRPWDAGDPAQNPQSRRFFCIPDAVRALARQLVEPEFRATVVSRTQSPALSGSALSDYIPYVADRWDVT